MEERITLSEALDLCETVMTNIGADLHDDIIQRLSIIRLQLDKIERAGYDAVETRESVIKIQQNFGEVVNAIREVARCLNPVEIEDGTVADRIEMMCQNIEQSRSLNIHTRFQGESTPLKSSVQRHLLRMVQELIHNALRHSSAWHIWIDGVWTPTHFDITVEDDGAGFSELSEVKKKLETRHSTLRMRARAINASLIYSIGQRGLVASISLPTMRHRSG